MAMREPSAMRLADVMRSPVWPGLLATLTLVALLVSFHHVVREAVQQGESRRKATAARVEAVWRCNALRSVRVRADCLLQLDSAPRDGAPLAPLHVTTLAVQ